MTMENQAFEDVFPIKDWVIFQFFILIFAGVHTMM